MNRILTQQEKELPAVETFGLVKIYNDKKVVDGIDLTIPAGKVYGILGPNGAGKTTTINMLTTLIRPDGGTAKLFGHDVQKEASEVRRLIGLTGQYASLDEKLSGYENLFIFSRLQGLSPAAAKKRAAQLLEEFNLTDAASRQVEGFSGGMKRRLDLAASLISEPPLLFLDEPTTGLDPRSRLQMWELIRGMVKNGTTVILTTQYLDEADQLADRIAVIDRGQVVAEGTANELKESIGKTSLHLHLSNKADIGTAEEIIYRQLGVKGAVSDEINISAPMASPGYVTDLLLAMRNAGVELAGMSVLKPTLDEVFLAITGSHTPQKQEASDAAQ
jgi:ABC-2 type transport system ATP-binding protein